MKTVVQRVTRAEVRVGGELVGRIERGLLLFVGVGLAVFPGDTDQQQQARSDAGDAGVADAHLGARHALDDCSHV